MKKYKIGLVLGRFQGVHLGHESIIDHALILCDEVLVFIGSSDKQGTIENPFPYEIRYNMLHDIYKDSIHIYPLPDLGVGNVPAWGDYVIENAKKVLGKPDLIIYGEEPKLNTWYTNYPDLAHVSVSRDLIPIDGTTLRSFIKKNKKEDFEKYTNPLIHKYYDELRKYLEEV